MKCRFFLLVFMLVFSITAKASIPGVTVEGGTISWTDTGGWMQVQDASTYDTVGGCSGFITSCETGEGEFNIIDHSNNQREDNVLVIVNPTGSLIRQTRNDCTFLSGAITDSASCIASCPAGSRLIAAAGCSARWRTDNFRIEPATFNATSGADSTVWTGVNCQVDYYEGGLFDTDELIIAVDAVCQYEAP